MDKSDSSRLAGELQANIPVVREAALGQNEPPFLITFQVVGPFEEPALLLVGAELCFRVTHGFTPLPPV